MPLPRGTCENCGRPDMGLQKLNGKGYCGVCTNTYYKYPPGADREKALKEAADRLRDKPKARGFKKAESTLGAGNPPPSSPPPPSKEGADFPVIVLSFPTERDRTLYHAIRGNAASARNEKVDQHVLHLLEKALSLSA